MSQQIAPLAVRPSTLSGLSEQMVVSHCEHHYGHALRGGISTWYAADGARTLKPAPV